jgi:hypothetical protein
MHMKYQKNIVYIGIVNKIQGFKKNIVCILKNRLVII